MESHGVSDKMAREARRVVAAFGCASFELESAGDIDPQGYCWIFGAQTDGLRVRWSYNLAGKLWAISVGNLAGTEDCVLAFEHQQWSCIREFASQKAYDAILARGLYCLGLEETEALEALGYPLSAHEKLELRLSLPRQLWPQSWLDEEKEKPFNE